LPLAVGSAQPEYATYRYDSLGRITKTSTSGAVLQENFAFDAASNLIDTTPARSTGLVAHNRIRVFEDKRFDYDGLGRLVKNA
jgi:hypothetical protein